MGQVPYSVCTYVVKLIKDLPSRASTPDSLTLRDIQTSADLLDLDHPVTGVGKVHIVDEFIIVFDP